MADSCRPVSRHGRYNASGPSSVQYSPDIPSYGNVDYTPTDEMYTVNQPARPERPKTSHGRRSQADIPPRPSSRRSRQVRRPDPNEESYGRPVSRVGFSPESDYRYSHDEYSRQIQGGKQLQNSPANSPEPVDIFSNEPIYSDPPLQTSPVDRGMLRDSPQSGKVDRLIVSPSSPNIRNNGQSPKGYRESPKGYRESPKGYRESPKGYRDSPKDYRESPKGYRESPKGYRESPKGYRDSPKGYRESPKGYRESPKGYRDSPKGYGQSPQGFRQSPQIARPSSRDHMSVSPIHRDEAQISEGDLHHSFGVPRGDHHDGQTDLQDGDRYTQRFQESPMYGSSPYRDSPQNREGPNYGTSPPDQPQVYTRPLPSQRPKSARPKTAGRKKSARARHRHEEIETSQPQHCDTSSILNMGDPYGRPSSSLSPYKPLPAIGLMTPRHAVSDESSGLSASGPSQVDSVTMETQRLDLESGGQFHPVDNDYDAFSAEDIQGASSGDCRETLSENRVPSVDALANLPQHLSGEIFEKSVMNFEQNMSQNDLDNDREKGSSYTDETSFDYYNSGNNADDDDNRIRSSEPKTLNKLHKLSDEPSEAESRVLLAIKLPDGKRIQRYFRRSETLGTVLHFAENASVTDLSDYWLVCNAPKVTFVDLSQKIEDTPIQDRTVLYLEEKD